MEWIHRSPQIHSTFGNLGSVDPDGYHVNENCDATLESILYNIVSEDKNLLTFRRSISYGQNIKKDLIPLLIHAKEDKTIELLLKILVNFTTPLESLLSVDIITRKDFVCTVCEIRNLLVSTKTAFSDYQVTRALIDFLKKNMNYEQKSMLSLEQCTNINNILLLLRNILHVPDDANKSQSPHFSGTLHAVRNQIIWNLFSQSIDKLLIRLMTISDATNWAVTMIQLIPLLYKGQYAATIHKHLDLWLESSLSESSEDNESNTSAHDRDRNDSSSMLTSDQLSELSDTTDGGNSDDEATDARNSWEDTSINKTSSENSNHNSDENTDTNKKYTTLKPKTQSESSSITSEDSYEDWKPNNKRKIVVYDNFYCGYGIQIDNQDSISTTSNEDEYLNKKPMYRKPRNPKQRANDKGRPDITPQEKKRKRFVKRGKSIINNVQGLSLQRPSDEDIAKILKEFTVDFLLKGFNALVKTLHHLMLNNPQLEMDKSHFFWLMTFFLKFASQIELDLVYLSCVLSFDIISYLTAEGVNLCEQFEMIIKTDANNLQPSLRRLHLAVTSIREFVLAIEMYKKCSHMCNKDQKALVNLQTNMCNTEELRMLPLLLLRNYNPKYHSKDYLKDLIITNHILIILLDSFIRLPDYQGTINIHHHVKQFATTEIMFKYGILLEHYEANGEFVNDCIFTMMHHVGGDLDRLITLFQPKILKSFTSIWKTEFLICDDWSDLIEYVINTFIKKPHTLQNVANHRLETESFDDDWEDDQQKRSAASSPSSQFRERWTEEELSALGWSYMQCSTLPDVPGEIIKLFKEEGIIKSRDAVIQELFKQSIISKSEYEKIYKGENNEAKLGQTLNRETRDEVDKLCEQLMLDGHTKILQWLQKALLETCYAKIYLQKKPRTNLMAAKQDSKLLNFELFKENFDDSPMISPVSYHSLLFKRSIPLVPWSCSQAAICKNFKFLQLLHKLGFHMRDESGKIFMRIPNFWTADVLYDVAAKILPIDTTQLKYSLSDIKESSHIDAEYHRKSSLFLESIKHHLLAQYGHCYQVHNHIHIAPMVNVTPMLGPSCNANGCVGVNEQNWLEMVQKAQDYKLTVSLPSHTLNAKEGSDKEGPTAALLTKVQDRECLVVPTEMSAEQDSSQNPLTGGPGHEAHSACETASVASDLTYMHVSDEDEKSEPLQTAPRLGPMDPNET